MAWTTPRTWSSGELVTASIMNTHVRDNFNAVIQGTSTITTTGTQTALTLPAGHGDLVVFANNASLLTIQGIAAGYDGQRITIYSIGAAQIAFAHQNGSASAANRLINFITSGLTYVAAGVGHASFIYDSTAARWRMYAHEQGAWITPTFAAGDYTGNGSMTWTVAVGDVTTRQYFVRGRQLIDMFHLVDTTVGGTPNVALQIAVVNAYTITKAVRQHFSFSDNGGAHTVGFAEKSGNNIALFYLDASTNWAASTDNTDVYGCIVMDVG